MVDVLIGGVSYWALGWGLSYGRGTNSFLGEDEFFSIGMDPNTYPLWFFQYVFAATASTIVSGAVAERVDFFAYFIYSIFIMGNLKVAIHIKYLSSVLVLYLCNYMNRICMNW